MKRDTRAAIAAETVGLVQAGWYHAPSGRRVHIGRDVELCRAHTRVLAPNELFRLRDEVAATPSAGFETKFEVANETTLAGLAQLLAESPEPVAVLNFASARNPGGGFLGGSQAQEESLARNSAMYASLCECMSYYEKHRISSSLLYSDAMILSPNCPVIRSDDGTLLETPQSATFITSPAPNKGAAEKNRPDELPQIETTLERRAELVLALAAGEGYRRLVLGAWGCGVFRNDPQLVADIWFGLLRSSAWAGRFEQVRFSVLDTSECDTFNIFQKTCGRSRDRAAATEPGA